MCAEVEHLVAAHGVEHVTISDDLFFTKSPASRQRAEDFARRLIRAKLGVSFMIDVRVDSIDTDLLRLLRDAGLRRMFVGVETSDPQQLDFYNKRYTRSAHRRDYIRRQLSLARDLGIDVVPGIITYHAESTIAELRETLDLIDGCGMQSGFFFLNRLIAYPGTEVYQTYRQRGLLTEDWPMPKWHFSDERVAEIERRMLAAEAEGHSFADLRALFASLVAPEPAQTADLGIAADVRP